MFTRARLELTASYLLIIVAILAVFSVVLFRYTAQHLRDALEEDPSRTATVERLVGELEYAILLGDGAVTVCAGVLCYWLAGRTLTPIKAALDAQERFSADASHELRTPLSVVKTDLEVYLKNPGATADEGKAAAARSLEEIERMSGMVEDLLALARSRKTETGIEREAMSVAAPVQAAVKASRRPAEAKGLSLAVRIDADALVMGNERLLERLFFNLVQNAVAATDEGGIAVTVSVPKDVVVEVADTGVGIAPRDLRRVFEPFYKADEARGAGTGAGLGLAIAKEIADRHGGAIRIASEPGKGTRVTVTLPVLADARA